MARRLLITDIDSTVCDHWKRIRANTVPHWPGGTISDKAWTWAELAKDKLLPDCFGVLHCLSAGGVDLGFLTARGWPMAEEYTRRQLEAWGLPGRENLVIVQTMADKVAKLKELKPNYYVDDFMTGQENAIGTFRHGIATAIQGLGIHVIVFRNDWQDVLDQIEYYEGHYA